MASATLKCFYYSKAWAVKFVNVFLKFALPLPFWGFSSSRRLAGIQEAPISTESRTAPILHRSLTEPSYSPLTPCLGRWNLSAEKANYSTWIIINLASSINHLRIACSWHLPSISALARSASQFARCTLRTSGDLPYILCLYREAEKRRQRKAYREKERERGSDRWKKYKPRDSRKLLSLCMKGSPWQDISTVSLFVSCSCCCRSRWGRQNSTEERTKQIFCRHSSLAIVCEKSELKVAVWRSPFSGLACFAHIHWNEDPTMKT